MGARDYQEVRRYAGVTLIVIASALVDRLAWTWIRPPVSPVFIFAILLSAWAGGWGASIVAALVAGWVTSAASLRAPLALLEPGHALQLGTYLGTALFASLIVGRHPRIDAGGRVSDAAATPESRARADLRFLVEASAALADSLDHEVTLGNLARLAVPRMADCCSIHVLEAEGWIRQVAVRHVRPDQEAFLRQLRRTHPVDPGSDHPVARAIASGEPVILADAAQLAGLPAKEEHDLPALVRSLSIESLLAAPLVAHGRALGALLLFSAGSGRRYGHDEAALAKELAQHAALAVEHARLYREAQHANLAKDRFLAVLSHEVRMPLMPALMAVSMLEREPGLPPRIASLISMMRRNVELEVRLIDDLLDLTRISRGKLSFHAQCVDVHEAANSAAETCLPDLHAKEIELKLELAAHEHHVSGDIARLRQIFWNLLRNAIKFTPRGGAIVVRSENPDPLHVRVSVADSGVGIEPEYLSHIFEPFEQGGTEVARSYGGLGLGLAIVRAIVQAHGGTITVFSRGRGQGSTFTVELGTMVPTPEEASLGGAQEAPVLPRSLRVLLVEDHEDTARLMGMLLQDYGCNVVAVPNIARALEAAAREPFDLLVTDIGLPDGNGTQLLSALGSRRPPAAIALSGHGMESDIRRSLDAGFVEHLVKPVDLRAFEGALRRATSKVEIPACTTPGPSQVPVPAEPSS